MLYIAIDGDTADAIVREALNEAIHTLQGFVGVNLDFNNLQAANEDIQALWHLMHAFNYFTPPQDHFDV